MVRAVLEYTLVLVIFVFIEKFLKSFSLICSSSYLVQSKQKNNIAF